MFVCLRIFGFELSVEMIDDLHFLRQSLSLLANLKYLYLGLLDIVLQHYILKFLKAMICDQTRYIIESHPYHSIT